MVGIECCIDRAPADLKDLLHVRNAVLKNQGLPVVDHGRNTARWCYAVDIAVE